MIIYLSTSMFFCDRESPLEFLGGLPGNSMNMLLHKLYLRDPFNNHESPYYPSIAKKLEKETERYVQLLLKERILKNADERSGSVCAVVAQ